jgi:F0F1-type ATP synthase epsilon subunit
MLALLMVLQMIPAMGEETQYTSGILVNNSEYRDKLEIEGPKALSVGEECEITVITEGYKNLQWSSSNPDIATVENGIVTGISAGTVKITAKEDAELDSIIIKVLETSAEGNEDESEEAEKAKSMVVIISGKKDKLTYDGKEHEYSGYTVFCNDSRFDETKLQLVNGERIITEKNCGIYKVKFEAEDFEYDDSSVKVVYDLNDGWMQIKPAEVTVKADDAVQKTGEELKLTATVTGLPEGEDPEVIQYTFDMVTTGDVTYIIPVCEEDQGNYKVTAQAGILTAEEGTPRTIKLTSDWPEGEPAYEGTVITMTAELNGFDDVDYTLQWQHSVDLEEWTVEPEATGTSFSFELNETNYLYTWRVVAKYKKP